MRVGHGKRRRQWERLRGHLFAKPRVSQHALCGMSEADIFESGRTDECVACKQLAQRLW